MHEIDPFDQLGEAVGLQNHRDQVRLGLLVAGHQVRRQCLRRSLEFVFEIDQAIARRQQPALNGSELGLLSGQPVLKHGQALVGVRQTVGGLADQRAVGSDL